MILGLILAISISIFITSMVVIISDFSGTIQDTLVTGAVVGSKSMMSYALVAFAISLVAIFYIYILMRMRFEEKRQQPLRFGNYE